MKDAIDRACSRIAPTWPLDRFIAVNPFWGCVDQPFSEVASTLRSLSGAELLMPRAWYREAYREGHLSDEHLERALAEHGSSLGLSELQKLLASDEPAPSPRPRVVDLLDGERDLGREVSWRSFVIHSISQQCAAYFDDGQATVGPDREGGLYASWRRHAPYDRSPSIAMSFERFRKLAAKLPSSAEELIAHAVDALGIPEEAREAYLWSLLLDLNGWAAWCAYRRWTARLDGRDDDAIRDLLAVRLAWELLLHRNSDDEVQRRWKAIAATYAPLPADPSRAADWILQSAMEIAWRSRIVRAMPAGLRAPRPDSSKVQVVFCIDVRSEVFRRALERVSSSVQTLGFAGFFGLPIAYAPLGDTSARPHLPGLLAPSLRASDQGLDDDAARMRTDERASETASHALRHDALATFTTVEALGLTYAWKLAKDSLGLSRSRDERRRPRLAGSADGRPLEDAARTDLAAGILRAMSLTHDFARVVLLAGHGSTTRNNPHAAGLDCGACGGQTGEVNARAAAALLNEPAVRAGLAARGISVPETTWFVAGLHDTTTDDLTLFDLEDVPATHRDDVASLQTELREAGVLARAERASRLRLRPNAPANLEDAIRKKSADWAEVRPEWGLANNAAFIVARREHCRHLDLEGRSFLHEYRHEEDEDGRILELIMTAPMVVTHWINLQYYASTVDNLRYGSGNKVLHNVVGGHLGVFEGNGGDLRIGLPIQSLHDGERWMHTPLRLSVFIEAPREAIDRVLAKHAVVRSLVNGGWLHLFQLDTPAEAVFAYRDETWREETAP